MEVRAMGDSAVLKCDSMCEYEEPVVWDWSGGVIVPTEGKYVLTKDNGLIILNMTKADESWYRCQSGRYPLSSYQLNMPGRLSIRWTLLLIVVYRMIWWVFLERFDGRLDSVGVFRAIR